MDRGLRIGQNRGENAGAKSKVQLGQRGGDPWSENTHKKVNTFYCHTFFHNK